MRWVERLKQVAGWDLFLQLVAVAVIFGLGLFVVLSESCEARASGADLLREPTAHAATQDPSMRGALPLRTP